MTQDDSGLPEAERAEGCGDSGVHGLSACGAYRPYVDSLETCHNDTTASD